MSSGAPDRSHVFGPVPSRRLGRSLGVDPVPLKTCSFDCVYCQLGRTTRLTTERQAFVPAMELIADLQAVHDSGCRPDWVTLSGSGEPTLSTEIRETIAWARRHMDVPVAVLTNGSLLWRDDVRRDVSEADLLIPSLDAALPHTYRRLNRPCQELELDRIIEGLIAARRDCRGRMWLEVMLVAGFNDSEEQLRALRAAIDRIGPDAVQVNTVRRPPAEAEARPVAKAALERVAHALGPKAEVIGPPPPLALGRAHGQTTAQKVWALLQRRPCTLLEVASGLGVHPNEASKYLGALGEAGAIRQLKGEGVTYYTAVGDAPPA